MYNRSIILLSLPLLVSVQIELKSVILLNESTALDTRHECDNAIDLFLLRLSESGRELEYLTGIICISVSVR